MRLASLVNELDSLSAGTDWLASLAEHGGQVRYEYSPANPILEKYGHASPSAAPSLRATPAGSSASLASEVFQSAPNSRSGTPSASPRMRTIDLAMTRSLKGDGTTSQQHSQRRHGSVDLSGGASSLRRVRSLAELQHKLEQTQREIESDDSLDDESASDDGTETATGTGEEGAETGDEWGDSRGASTTASGRSSRFSSRATSRAASRVQSREVSPLRRRVLEPLSGLDPHGGTSQAHTDLVMVRPLVRTSSPSRTLCSLFHFAASHPTTRPTRTLATQPTSRRPAAASTQPGSRARGTSAGASATSSAR